MLPHYSPLKVAENFGVLSGLFPGRIDLGIGRAAGTDPMTTHALQRDRSQRDARRLPRAAGRAARLLRAQLPGRASAGAARRVAARQPRGAGGLAARLLDAERGLGRANWACPTPSPTSSTRAGPPTPTSTARSSGRGAARRARASRSRCGRSPPRPRRRPSGSRPAGGWPSTCCAAAARSPCRRRRRRQRYLGLHEEEREGVGGKPRRLTGTAAQVRAGIEEVVEAYGAEEAIVVTITHDHEARRRSYELMAEEFGLAAGAPTRPPRPAPRSAPLERRPQTGDALRAAQGLDDPAARVEDDRGRQAAEPVAGAVDAVGVLEDREGPAVFADEFAAGVGLVGVVDADQPAGVAERALEALQLRRLLAAGLTPARPEVDQRRLAAQARQRRPSAPAGRRSAAAAPGWPLSPEPLERASKAIRPATSDDRHDAARRRRRIALPLQQRHVVDDFAPGRSSPGRASSRRRRRRSRRPAPSARPGRVRPCRVWRRCSSRSRPCPSSARLPIRYCILPVIPCSARNFCDGLRRVAARVGRDGDDLQVLGLRPELGLGGLQVADDQRADVRAVGVDEGDEDRLALELGEVDRFAERVAQLQRRAPPSAVPPRSP